MTPDTPGQITMPQGTPVRLHCHEAPPVRSSGHETLPVELQTLVVRIRSPNPNGYNPTAHIQTTKSHALLSQTTNIQAPGSQTANIQAPVSQTTNIQSLLARLQLSSPC